jgi:hypothetical protein
MAAESICDGCGKREPMLMSPSGNWFKPKEWYERVDPQTKRIMTACCRACVGKVAEETKTDATIMPNFMSW